MKLDLHRIFRASYKEEDQLLKTRVVDGGVVFETGVPVRFQFLHNTETSPQMGGEYQQDIEPDGMYVIHNTRTQDEPNPGWIRGVAKVKNPLVIKFGEGGYDENSWKQRVYDHFGGGSDINVTGNLKKAGFDAVVTVDRWGPSEIILLDPEKQAHEA